jgi:hypothetical protein
MESLKYYIDSLLTALGGGGVVFLITYFFKGKKDRSLEQKTIIGYLKERITILEKKQKEDRLVIEEMQKKYVELEFKLHVAVFENEMMTEWIKEKKDGEQFLNELKTDLKNKKAFLEKMKKLSLENSLMQEFSFNNFYFVISFIFFTLGLFFFFYSFLF